MVALLRAITRMLYLFGKGWEENLHVDASEGQEGVVMEEVEGIQQLLQQQQQDQQIPLWIKHLFQVLRTTNERNIDIRFFVLRLLMNQPVSDLLKPCIYQLLPSFLSCICRDLCPSNSCMNASSANASSAGASRSSSSSSSISKVSENTCKGFHYMLRDVCYHLTVTWKDSLSHSFSTVISASVSNDSTDVTLLQQSLQSTGEHLAVFMTHLLTVFLVSEDSQMTKQHLQVLKTLFSQWFLPLMPSQRPPNSAAADSTSTNSHEIIDNSRNIDTEITTAGKLIARSIVSHLDLSAVVKLLKVAHAGSGGKHSAADSEGSIARESRIAGLNVVCILIKSGFPLLLNNELTETTRQQVNNILRSICENLYYPRKEVIVKAAETAGLIMAIMKQWNGNGATTSTILVNGCTEFEGNVTNSLLKRMKDKRSLESVGAALGAISRYCPWYLPRKLFIKVINGDVNFHELRRGKGDFLFTLMVLPTRYSRVGVESVEGSSSGSSDERLREYPEPFQDASIIKHLVEMVKGGMTGLLTDLTMEERSVDEMQLGIIPSIASSPSSSSSSSSFVDGCIPFLGVDIASATTSASTRPQQSNEATASSSTAATAATSSSGETHSNSRLQLPWVQT